MGTDTATNQEEEQITTNISTSFEHNRVISMLLKSGCLDSHFKVQDCMVEHKDWRMCQDQLKKLQACLQKNHDSLHSTKESI
jgi:cytochrome c oxidase assembly factor 4